MKKAKIWVFDKNDVKSLLNVFFISANFLLVWTTIQSLFSFILSEASSWWISFSQALYFISSILLFKNYININYCSEQIWIATRSKAKYKFENEEELDLPKIQECGTLTKHFENHIFKFFNENEIYFH